MNGKERGLGLGLGLRDGRHRERVREQHIVEYRKLL
jgi:hypothetical protein